MCPISNYVTYREGIMGLLIKMNGAEGSFIYLLFELWYLPRQPDQNVRLVSARCGLAFVGE